MSRRILLVDDEEDILEVATMSLELIGGFEVLTAGSGAEALDVATRERPDAILLDMMMPGLDGPATLARLRGGETTRRIPVLLLTAKSPVRDRVPLEALDVRGVVTKPFDVGALPAQVTSALGWDIGR